MDRLAAAIHRLAFAIVGPDEAADVTQEVLVIAWRKAGQLRDVDHEAAWLRRIVVNRCLDRERAARRRPRTIALTIRDNDPRIAAPTDPDASGFDPILDTAIRGLPVEQRAVIALHYAAALPIADVADALKVPIGTAKSRLATALERLRHDLEARR